MSCTSKPLDWKHAKDSFHEMDGDGRSTDSLVDVIPSLLPVNTG